VVVRARGRTLSKVPFSARDWVPWGVPLLAINPGAAWKAWALVPRPAHWREVWLAIRSTKARHKPRLRLLPRRPLRWSSPKRPHPLPSRPWSLLRDRITFGPPATGLGKAIGYGCPAPGSSGPDQPQSGSPDIGISTDTDGSGSAGIGGKYNLTFGFSLDPLGQRRDPRRNWWSIASAARTPSATA
jgi:hypothetical protein